MFLFLTLNVTIGIIYFLLKQIRKLFMKLLTICELYLILQSQSTKKISFANGKMTMIFSFQQKQLLKLVTLSKQAIWLLWWVIQDLESQPSFNTLH